LFQKARNNLRNSNNHFPGALCGPFSFCMKTYLRLGAEYYDLDTPSIEEAAQEYAFYRAYAFASTGPILEPMCGSGRFLLPLHEEGFEIHGCDASPFMLERLKQQAALRGIVPQVWHQSLEELHTPHRYGLIFIPFSSFNLIIDRTAVQTCLQKIYDHLVPDGTFVFEVELYYTPLPEAEAADLWTESCRSRPDGSRIVLRKKALPPTGSVVTVLCDYEEQDPAGTAIGQEREIFSLRFYHPGEIESLLREAGFGHVRWLAPFDPTATPLFEEESLICECKKL
jgi:SAM-dependent methyltransferase